MKKYVVYYKDELLYHQEAPSIKSVMDGIREDLEWDKEFENKPKRYLKNFKVKLDRD